MNQQKLPNATASLILGILSIPSCMCYGILGFVLGIIGLVLANKDTKLYQQNPSLYDNYGNVQAGKILSIIGISLGIIYLILIVIAISIFGIEALSDQELLMEKLEKYQK